MRTKVDVEALRPYAIRGVENLEPGMFVRYIYGGAAKEATGVMLITNVTDKKYHGVFIDPFPYWTDGLITDEGYLTDAGVVEYTTGKYNVNFLVAMDATFVPTALTGLLDTLMGL